MRRDDAGSDFLGLLATAAPARGVTSWLTAALRAAIVQGRLVEQARLPPSRTLAKDLGVARGVVVQAYQRLSDEGLVSARPRVGTVVLALDVPPAGDTQHPAPPIPGPAMPGPSMPVLPPRRAGQAEVDLSPGVPDLAAFPRAAWLRAERAVLRDASAADLGYGDPRGCSALRRALAGWLATARGVRADHDDIIVVAGVAQSLALLAQTMRAKGETAVGVEDPGSRGVRDELEHWGLTPMPIVVDDHGLRVDELERIGPKTVVLTPAHQFPTGVVLSPARRRALLEWARDDRLIIEDDYDAEHRYDRAPVRALQPLAASHVAHTGSTSKTLAPGMRLGWLVAPRRLHADLVAAKHASDLGSPAIPQLVLAQLLVTGAYDRHLRLVRTRQRRRRDAVLAALAEHLPGARVQGVAAGLHLVIMLPDEADRTDDRQLAAAVRQAGVLVQPLSWHRHRPGPPGLVLGYAAHPPDRLNDAVRRMAAALRAYRAPGNRAVDAGRRL